MKVIFFAHEFCIKEGGPCTHRIDSFASYLSNNGHDVVVLTGKHNKKKEYDNLERDYKILYAPILALGKKKNIYRLIEQLSFSFFSFFYGVFKLKKADYFVTTCPPPLISSTGYYLSKIKKAKLIYDIRDIWPDVALEMGSFSKTSIYYKLLNNIAKKIYKRADYITTVSPGKVDKINKYCGNSNKVWYVPNGLDDNFLDFSEDKTIIQKYNLKDKFTISYVGNVGLAQNLDILVELAQKNIDKKDVQFLIFGDGAYREQLTLKVNKLGLNNIKVAGRIDYKDVYSIIKYSKVSFVSLKNMQMIDSIPTKMFDALGLGCPVLLYAKGDSAQILKESNLGESAENFNELCSKFDKIYNNYESYIKHSKNCIRYILDNYSRKKIAQKLEEYMIKNGKKNN